MTRFVNLVHEVFLDLNPEKECWARNFELPTSRTNNECTRPLNCRGVPYPWGPVQVIKHLDGVKGHYFWIHKKNPLASKEGGLIVISKRWGFKGSLRKMLLRHLLDLVKGPPLLKDFRVGFDYSLQKKNKELPLAGFEPGPPEWQEEMMTTTPCHSPLQFYNFTNFARTPYFKMVLTILVYRWHNFNLWLHFPSMHFSQKNDISFFPGLIKKDLTFYDSHEILEYCVV